MIKILFYAAFIIIGSLLAFGLFNFLLIAVKAPSLQTSKTIRRITVGRRKSKDAGDTDDSILRIDKDLPRFVYTVANELKSKHDVLSILERHKDSFSPDFANELTITIADMRTGSYEAALQRFEGRIGSTSLSEVVRGLIELTKGNKSHVYWETLVIRFSEMQKQELRKEAQKVPPKVSKLSFGLLICLMLLYGVVLLIQVIENIGILF